MKILTNWSVPTNKAMKYVKRTALAATVLLGGVYAGTNIYYNNYDSFVRTNVEDTTYKVNEGQIEQLQQYPYNTFSYNELAEAYEKYGLYAGSAHNQCYADLQVIEHIIDELEEETGRESACRDAKEMAIEKIIALATTMKHKKNWKDCVSRMHDIIDGYSNNGVIDKEEIEHTKLFGRQLRRDALAENNEFGVARGLACEVNDWNGYILKGCLKNYGFSEESINGAYGKFLKAYGEVIKY